MPEVNRQVAGTDKLGPMGGRIEHRHHCRGKPLIPAAPAEALIDPRHSLGHITLARQAVAHIGGERRHHQRRRHSLARHIGQHDGDPALRQRHISEEITPHLLRRLVIVENLVARNIGRLRGEQPLLYPMGDLEIAFELRTADLFVVGQRLLDRLGCLPGHAGEHLEILLREPPTAPSEST